MGLTKQVMAASMSGLILFGRSDVAHGAEGPLRVSCSVNALVGPDAEAITVSAVSVPTTAKCAGERQFLDEIKKRIWLAWVQRARPRPLQQYSYDVQAFAWATWSAPIGVRVTPCTIPTASLVGASAACPPSIGVEESGENDIVDLAATEATSIALASGVSTCGVAGYSMTVRFDAPRLSDRTRVGPVACLLLRSESPEVRRMAAETLGSMGRHVAKQAMAGLKQAETTLNLACGKRCAQQNSRSPTHVSAASRMAQHLAISKGSGTRPSSWAFRPLVPRWT
jgi:hypothetical protein